MENVTKDYPLKLMLNEQSEDYQPIRTLVVLKLVMALACRR
jgi:hypothetical protein